MVFSRHLLAGDLRGSMLAIAFLALAPAVPASAQWTQWGGPNRNFKVDAADLADQWPAGGPRKLWHRELGSGFSSIVADGGVLYTMYRKEKTDPYEYTIALDAKTGTTLWQTRDLAAVVVSLPATASKSHVADVNERFTGPNSTPLIVGDLLFTVGRNGLLNCRRRSDGKAIWKHDLVKEFGGVFPHYGYAASPLAYKETIILPLGQTNDREGEGYSLVAFDQTTGDVIWHQHKFEIFYSSPILITFDGQDQLVQCTAGPLIGVNPTNGDLLWKYEPAERGQFRSAWATPVWNGKDVVMISGKEVGCAVRLTKQGDKTSADLLWSTNKAPMSMLTPIYDDDLQMLIGSVGRFGGRLVGKDAKTGERLWTSPKLRKTVLVAAGDKLILLRQYGTLYLATATRERLIVHSQWPVTTRSSLAAPTLVGTTLYVRDEVHIMALDLGARGVDGGASRTPQNNE